MSKAALPGPIWLALSAIIGLAVLLAGLLLSRQATVSENEGLALSAASYQRAWQDGYRAERRAWYRRGQRRGELSGQRSGARLGTERGRRAGIEVRQAAQRAAGQRANRRAERQERLLAQNAVSGAGVSAAAVQFIAEFEGLCSTPCNDPVGYATIGHGHLIAYRPVNASDWRRMWVPRQQAPGRLTTAEAAELLRQDLGEVQREVLRRLPGVPLAAEMITALVSFAFNLGPGYLDARPDNGYTRATNISARLRAGQYLAAAREMRIYDGAISGGKRIVFPGLTRRRNDEYQLMLRGIDKLGVD